MSWGHPRVAGARESSWRQRHSPGAHVNSVPKMRVWRYVDFTWSCLWRAPVPTCYIYITLFMSLNNTLPYSATREFGLSGARRRLIAAAGSSEVTSGHPGHRVGSPRSLGSGRLL